MRMSIVRRLIVPVLVRLWNELHYRRYRVEAANRLPNDIRLCKWTSEPISSAILPLNPSSKGVEKTRRKSMTSHTQQELNSSAAGYILQLND